MTTTSPHIGSPHVSVIIPCFNAEATIDETLQSLVNQTVGCWEAIIVDDGSDDGSIALVKRRCEQDNRFRLYERDRSPKGVSTCRNIGIAMAGGEWVIFLDADDILVPSCLEQRLASVTIDPTPDFSIFKMMNFDTIPGDQSKLLNKYAEDPTSYLDMFLNHELPWAVTCPIWRHSFIQSIGGFDESFPRLEDPEFHARALLHSTTFIIDKHAPVDCYRRVTPDRNRPTIYYDQCLEGFGKFVRHMNQLLLDTCSREDVDRHRSALKQTADEGINFMLRHRKRIRVQTRRNFLRNIASSRFISAFRSHSLLAATCLPHGVTQLIIKTGISKLIRRISPKNEL